MTPDLARTLREMRDAAPGYGAAKEYDDINLWEGFLQTRAGRTFRQADIEYDPNFCGVVIDAVANGMTISGIVGTTDVETALANDIWHVNQLDLYYPSWQRNALRDGDGYLVAWVKPEAELAGDITALTPEDINVTYVDPRRGRMFYDEEDPREKLWFAMLWCEPSEEKGLWHWRANLMYPDRIERYVTEDKTIYSGAEMETLPGHDQFMPCGEDGAMMQDMPLEMNPYGRITACHLRTDVQYGRPEHRNAFALQDAVSKLIEMQMVTVNFQGWPQAYALQELESLGTQTIREDPTSDRYAGGLLDDDFTDAPRLNTLPPSLTGVETGSEIELSPGTVLMLKNIKAFGQLQSADPNAFLEPWREYGKAISSTTDTPAWKFSGLGVQVPSGFALKVANQPLNKKIDRRCSLAGAALRDLYQSIFAMLGQDDVVITIEWESPELIDETERWTLVKLRVDAGVPLKDALVMAGIPERKAQEWADAEEARKVAQLELERERLMALSSANRPPAPVPAVM
jgi:hypothetical protein